MGNTLVAILLIYIMPQSSRLIRIIFRELYKVRWSKQTFRRLICKTVYALRIAKWYLGYRCLQLDCRLRFESFIPPRSINVTYTLHRIHGTLLRVYSRNLRTVRIQVITDLNEQRLKRKPVPFGETCRTLFFLKHSGCKD